MSRVPTDAPPHPQTIAEEEDEFTNEGAPAPGLEVAELPTAGHAETAAPGPGRRPTLSLSRSASLRRHERTSIALPR
jgi:hypothetical protein